MTDTSACRPSSSPLTVAVSQLAAGWKLLSSTADAQEKAAPQLEEPRCRFSAPLSFLTHHAFMQACRRQVALRYALVATLLMMVTLTSAAPFPAAGAVAAAMNAHREGLTAHAERLPSRVAADPVVSMASCPTAASVPAAFALPSSDPFSSNSSFSFFPPPSQAVAHHAHWRLHYWDSWKLIENLVAGEQYMLVMRGADPASVPTLVTGQVIQPPDHDEHHDEPITILPNLRVFTVPIERLCVEETIGLSFVELLGLRQRITLLGQYSTPTSPCVNTMQLGEMESEYGNLTKRAQQVAANCDLVLGSNDAGPPGEKQHVSFATTAETDLLARAEWLEFVAAFFNREQAANAITSGISARYNRTAELVRAHPPSVSTTEVEPPLVAWLSIYSGTVTIGTTSLREDYTAVAGGKLFVPTVKTYSNLTAFREMLSSSNIAVIVDETYAPNPTAYRLDTFLNHYGLPADGKVNGTVVYPFLARKQVWRFDALVTEGTLALDWFESAISNADALLADLASLMAEGFGGDEQLGHHEQVWFRNIAADVPGPVRFMPTACPDVTAPLRLIEAAEGALADDPVMVASCPAELLAPWSWTPEKPSDGGDGGDDGDVLSTTAIILIVVLGGAGLVLVAVAGWFLYRKNAGTGAQRQVGGKPVPLSSYVPPAAPTADSSV